MNSPKHLIEKVKEVKAIHAAKSHSPNKLTADERLYLIGLIGKCYSPYEIQKDMYERFRKNVSSMLLYQYSHTKKWIPVIKKIREEYDIEVNASPMASKRARLDRLDRAYDAAVRKDEPENMIRATSQSQREKEGLHKDGDVTNVFWNNPTYHQMMNLSNEELLRIQKEATQKLLSKEEK